MSQVPCISLVIIRSKKGHALPNFFTLLDLIYSCGVEQAN